MSAFVLWSAAGHRLALGAERVERFDRGTDGRHLLAAAPHADWVLALTDGQRWRSLERPELLEIDEVWPLPPLLAGWATRHGVVGCSPCATGLVLVVSPDFAREGAV